MRDIFFYIGAVVYLIGLVGVASGVPWGFVLGCLGLAGVSIGLFWVAGLASKKTKLQKQVEETNNDPERVAQIEKEQADFRAGREYGLKGLQRAYWDEVGDKEDPTEEELIFAIARGKLTGVRFVMPVGSSYEFTWAAKRQVQDIEDQAQRLVVDERF